MASSQKRLRIGVLYEHAQMTDLAGLDILGNCSTKTVKMISEFDPRFKPYLEVSREMEFLYIASELKPTWTTPEMYVTPTHTYDNAPRDLDIILIGGPDPSKAPPASFKFLQEASKQTKVIITTCTGGMWLAASGVLDGKKATTNRFALDMAKQFFPKVEWQEARWVIEKGHFEGAEMWTAGGAGCGIDLVAKYARQTFDPKLVEVCLMGLDFKPEQTHGEFYTTPQEEV
ncbi:class I glutamine amidotransferase-like protein [Polyplosphaeria fusca]|uniref:Class I glutamine amidotransferase-like protein n=1 Tax=Polyplosphaeria fusca TaxID=682080 RepID=A0A9P4V6A6_9PLEO|nr:class I glutamine amidotransferase-like protein [Polyplosphaeria fusca]